ncbi:hypothetical protein OG302_20650 [Streptomyces sp. NBC_01283]|uniref:hypothetical protein n=1 Tax=Streptomyces sp. NBC_01283 TaxID=2903812 RepID=UPI00352DEC35|nr:hypothetical protein OG302_20650 [Streptomyces sp. NBC_01283]
MLRRSLSAVLLVLAVLLVPLGALSTWAKYEIEDADRYVATMAPLASDPDVRDAVADAVTDGVAKAIDAGPLQDTVESFVRDAVRSFTGTPAFEAAWKAANREAHAAVQDALTDQADGGAVTIDLAPITEQVERQLDADGVPFADRIPVTHTEVTLMESSDLGPFGKGFHMLQVAGLWLPLAAVLLAVAGIFLAVHRRRAIIRTALGAALAGAALALAVMVGRGLTLDDLPKDVSRPAAEAVYDALTSSLSVAGWVILGVGLAAALAAWLLRRMQPSRTSRRL